MPASAREQRIIAALQAQADAYDPAEKQSALSVSLIREFFVSFIMLRDALMACRADLTTATDRATELKSRVDALELRVTALEPPPP